MKVLLLPMFCNKLSDAKRLAASYLHLEQSEQTITLLESVPNKCMCTHTHTHTPYMLLHCTHTYSLNHTSPPYLKTNWTTQIYAHHVLYTHTCTHTHTQSKAGDTTRPNGLLSEAQELLVGEPAIHPGLHFSPPCGQGCVGPGPAPGPQLQVRPPKPLPQTPRLLGGLLQGRVCKVGREKVQSRLPHVVPALGGGVI